VLQSWGPGKFDAELFLDGKAFRPDGKTAATLLPPAFGLSGVNLHTFTGFGSVTYWNAFVANLEMHGQGTFYDPRLEDAAQFPVAARAGFGNVRNNPDLVTPKLAALHFYQLALPAPEPPAGSFDRAAAARGKVLFTEKAACARCHVPPLYTEPGWNLHKPEEIGIDSFQSDRSPERRYRTTPLKGLWSHAKGGFYHDGRFPTLEAVVDHYDGFQALGLSAAEKSDLVQFLKSL
jgi:cytochrome c peroxidase